MYGSMKVSVRPSDAIVFYKSSLRPFRSRKNHGRELGESQEKFRAEVGSFWTAKELGDFGKGLRDDE